MINGENNHQWRGGWRQLSGESAKKADRNGGVAMAFMKAAKMAWRRRHCS